MGDGKPFRAGRELLRLMVGRSPHTLAAIALAGVEWLPKRFTPAAEKHNVARGLALAQRIREVLGNDAILLFPPHPTTAPLVCAAAAPIPLPLRHT
jgi:fatty acid amide hydrolase 2